jgi:hypothetical protein
VAAVLLAASVGLSSPAQAQTRGAELSPEPVRIEQPAAVDSVRAAIDGAFAEIDAADANEDGKVVGRRWRNETDSLSPLASAVYDYVDYVHPRGNYSFWGSESRGDYMSGGLGLGFTMRPVHGTANRILLDDDLQAGRTLLLRALDAAPRTDLAASDLSAMTEVAKAMYPNAGPAEIQAHIAAAADGLIEHIVEVTENKERTERNSTALPTHAEVRAGLDPASLEAALADRALGDEGQFFARELQTMSARRAAFGAEPRNETGKAGDAAMHYILVIGKRAQEASLLANIRAQLP